MPQDVHPLQTDELVKFLHEHQECAIVHRETGHEVGMFTDLGKPERPWYASYVHYDILERDLLKQALAIGFKLRARDCTDYAEYELYQNCHGITIAAIRALRLARMLPGVAPDAWLWITVPEYDAREDPPGPPAPWPPLPTE